MAAQYKKAIYKKNLVYIKNIIYSIVCELEDDEIDGVVLDVFEEYSKLMLKFIKIKGKNWFKFLFKTIEDELNAGTTYELIREIIPTIPKNGKQLITYIIDVIFDDECNDDISYDDSDEDSCEDEDSDEDSCDGSDCECGRNFINMPIKNKKKTGKLIKKNNNSLKFEPLKDIKKKQKKKANK
jgi:hypothetical protein